MKQRLILINRWIKRALLLLVIVTGVSCSTTKYIPIESKEIIRDSIVYVEIPKEVIRDAVPIHDTLYLETELASSKAYIENNQLKGTLKHKPVRIEKTVQFVETIKEVPLKVTETVFKPPKWAWWSLGINALLVLLFGLKIVLKCILK